MTTRRSPSTAARRLARTQRRRSESRAASPATDQSTTVTLPPASRRVAPSSPVPPPRAKILLWTAVTVTMAVIIVGWVQVQRTRLTTSADETRRTSQFEQIRDDLGDSLTQFRDFFTSANSRASSEDQKLRELQDRVFPQFVTEE